MKNILIAILLLLTFSATAQEQQNGSYFDNIESNIFVDVDGASSTKFNIGGPSVVAGFQFGDHVFLGLGGTVKLGAIREEYCDDDDWWDNDVFGGLDLSFNVRYFMLEKARWNPYFDLRVGNNLISNDGYDFSSSIALGNRFAIRRGDAAFNLSAGYMMLHFKQDKVGYSGAFMLRFGIEI